MARSSENSLRSARTLFACVLAIAGGVLRDARLLVPVFASACRAAANDAVFSGKLRIGSSHGRADLDGDGVDDCWNAIVSSGSGGDSVSLEVEAPCGSEPLAIDTMTSFEDFLARTPLPSALAARPRLIEGIVDLMYGRGHMRATTAIDDSFRLLLREPPRWSAGAPRVPPSQVIVRHDPDEVIAYFAQNHGQLRAMTRCDGIEVLATHHGVVLYDPRREQSSWVYIANGHEKLRWPSIAGVSCGEQGALLVQDRDQILTIPIRRSSSP